jgi:RNA polymerase sigma-70 factor, ECF subfamily
LDHLLRFCIEVIQKAVPIVFQTMNLAVQKHAPLIARMVPRLRRLALSPGRARRSPLQMPSESEATTDRMQWGRLIRAIATQQDRTAFSALFEYFAPRIKSFMQRSGASEARAEELAQETMLAVWRKAGLFDPASTGAAAWIFTIARNLRIDAHRRERRGGVIETSDAEIEFQIDDSPQPDSRLATVQSEERIRSALAKLSADQIRVVELSFFDEKAHAEIAKILGIPLGTVKSRLRLAISRLRTLLSELS